MAEKGSGAAFVPEAASCGLVILRCGRRLRPKEGIVASLNGLDLPRGKPHPGHPDEGIQIEPGDPSRAEPCRSPARMQSEEGSPEIIKRQGERR
jgi:hypothetical protein